MLRSMLFQRPGVIRSFIPGDYSRQHTEEGRVQDGRGGGLTNVRLEKVRQKKKSVTLANGDGTGGLTDTKDRESQD